MFTTLFFVSCGDEPPEPSAARSPNPKPYVIELAPDDAERAYAEEQLQLAYTRFLEMFGFAPPLRVFIFDSVEELVRSPLLAYSNHPSIFVFKSRRLFQLESAGSSSAFEGSSFSHEAAHKLAMGATDALIKANRVQVDPRRMDTYGHALAPDWLEESIAILCEDPADGQWRIDYIKSHAADLHPLQTLLTMRHPISSEIAEHLAESQSKDPAQPNVLKLTPGLVQHAELYYSQLHALAHYIYDTEGPTFFRDALSAAVNGASVEQIIGMAKRMPTTIEALEQVYLEKYLNPG